METNLRFFSSRRQKGVTFCRAAPFPGATQLRKSILVCNMHDLLTGALWGALISSLVAPYILQTKERRVIRAQALNAIFEVELSRWAEGTDYQKFRKDITTLRAAALVARVDRKMLEHYVYLAAVSRFCSDNDLAGDPEEEYRGMIPSELSNLTQSVAEDLTILLWHPLRSRPFKRKHLAKRKHELESYREKTKKEAKKTSSPARVYWDVRI